MVAAKRITLGRANISGRLLCTIVAVLFVCPAEGKSPKDPATEAAAQLLVTEARNLRAAFEQQSARQALEKLAAARAYWQRIGDVRSQVATLADSAEILVDLSAYQEALKTYQEQLRLSATTHDQIRALNGLSTVHIYLGNQPQAFAYCKRAEKLSRLAHDTEGEAESLINAGEVLYFQGDGEQALRAFNKALTLVADRFWRMRARALIDIGYAHFDLRQMDLALDYYEKSLKESRDRGNRRGEALALTAIAGVNSYLGNKHTALNYNSDAIALFRTIGDRNGEGVTLNGLGYVYRNLGEYEKSLDCYLQALRLFETLGTREAEYFTLTRVGKAYELLGEGAKAIEYYELAARGAANYPQTKVTALYSIGNVLESLNQPEKARVYYTNALTLYRKIGDRMGEAGALNSLAMLPSNGGTNRLQTLRTARAITQAVQDRRGEIAVLLNTAKALCQLKNYPAARATIEESLKLIESLRAEAASTALRASYFSSVRQHYELYVDVLMQLSRDSASPDYVVEAFAASERAHARSLVEMLAETRDKLSGVDPALLEKMRAVQAQLNALAERRMTLLAHGKTGEALEISRQIDQLGTQYDELEGTIRFQNHRYASLTQPQPLTLAQIQQRVLDHDSILLEYMLGEERSYVWAVTRTDITSYELPARARIETAARKFRDLLTVNQTLPNETFSQRQARISEADAQIPEAAAALSDLVIAPVQQKLGTKRLIIVADGALHYIPFLALTVPPHPNDVSNPGDRIPLLVNHEIVYEPSASALAYVRNDGPSRDAPKSIAVFANPVFEADDLRVTNPTAPNSSTDSLNVGEVFRDLGISDGRVPALPASRDEAEAIMSFAPWGTGLKALGFEANRAAVTHPDLAQYRIVHFATHGFVDYERPELSGLVLSLVDRNGQPQDGYLRLHDIYNLKLSADLVVLSACNTGMGKAIKGEGLISLTRGFMYAGAGSVAASLWKVDDEATAELMARFYEGMFRKGLTPSAALREAQLSMWRQKRWQAPYHWAAFIIQGRYNQTEIAAASNPGAQWLVTSAGLFGVCLLAACLVFGRRRSRTL